MKCPGCLKEVQGVFVERWKEYTMWQCPHCELVFSEPRKNPGASWYGELDAYSIPSHFTGNDLLGWHHRQFFKKMPNPKGKLLDIGCSTGVFIWRAKRLGYRVTGIDFNEWAIQKAKGTYGLNDVYALPFEQFVAENSGGSYNIITFFEVLEHQEEPDEFIQKVTSLISPGGIICLSVPNNERRPRFFIEGDYPPHHFTRWKKSTLTHFLGRHGFEVVQIVESPVQIHWVLGNAIRLGIGRRFLERAKKSNTSSPEQQDALQAAGKLQKWKILILWYLGIPIDFVLKLFGAKGFQLVVFARKRT